MKSDSGTGRITISGVPDDLLEELDALADAEDKNRSEKVVELIRGEVGDAVADDSGDYLPTDDTLRAVYEAMLDAARMPDHTIRFDIHGGEVAQNAGLSQTAVRGNLFRLQSRGYVRHQRTKDATAQHGEVYRVKPRCANPKAWRFSKARDADVLRALEASDPPAADDPENASETLDELRGDADD